MTESRRPRALLLTPVLPSDRGNGLAMRAGLLLTGLARAFSVDVILMPTPGPDPRGATFTGSLVQRLEILDGGPPDRLADATAMLATPEARARAQAIRPMPGLCRGASHIWAARVAELAVGAELVLVFRSYLAPLLDELIDAPERPAIVIDIDDVDSETQMRLGHPEQAERFERLERYYLPQADHVLTASVLDARRVAAVHRLSAVTAMPNALSLPLPAQAEPSRERAEPMTATPEPVDLLFVGNLSYGPNAEAARWLCESVVPLLGEISVAIIGSGPSDETRSLARDARVTVVADPEDVGPWYARARVAVVPLLRGGGSRLKLIEALAHSRPVVSTTVGAHGLPWNAANRSTGVVLADQPAEFAAACRELLAGPDGARALGEAGQEIVGERASIDVVAPRVARVGQEAVWRRGARAHRPGAAPLLTAALIVRDEEAVLEECLESLAGVADEVVIVDTGSVDATVAIAKARGAEVLHQPWAGGFAAPRNYGLGHANGVWILYIDADERVAPIDRAALTQHLQSSSATAMRVLLRPTVSSTPYHEYRLWRNDPRIRFRGVMHEQVVDAIHSAADDDGRAVELWSGLLLEHVGYEGDQSRKHARNLPLLQAQLERTPDNIFIWRHLSQVLDGLGRPDEAREALGRATSLALAEPRPTALGGLVWAELVRREHERGSDVSELLAVGRERWPDHWLIRWMNGTIALDAGRLIEAEEAFSSLIEVDTATLPAQGVAYDARMFGEWAHASLALTFFRAGRNDEAAAAYAEAERLAPESSEYRIKRMLALARAQKSADQAGPQ